MKVNFWQALGVVLIVVGVILFVRNRISTNDAIDPATDPAPVTQPGQ